MRRMSSTIHAPLAGAQPFGTRLAAALRAASLDRALADGADPAGSRALTMRAARLTSKRQRLRLAEGIERLSVSPTPGRSPIIGGDPDAMRANRGRLSELAGLLRADTPLRAGGVASLRLLLADPCSPAHVGDAAAVTEALGVARHSMEGGRHVPAVASRA